jgi:putative ATP-binding cassette transporter
MAWSFVGLGLGKLAMSFVSQAVLARISQRSLATLRRGLARKIIAVPLRRLEELGTPRLMAALTEDVLTIAESLPLIPNFAVNLATLCGGAIYLCLQSWHIALGMVLFIVVGAAGYRLMVVNGFGQLRLAREEADRLFGHFRALTEGIKELKLHRSRCKTFLTGPVMTTTEQCSRHNVAAETRFILAQSWSHFLFLALVGIILFLLPTLQGANPRTVTSFVVIALWLIGPLTGVLSVLSAFGRASVALDKIDRLGLTLATQTAGETATTGRKIDSTFERLELLNVTHSYHNEKDDSHFVLGPVNLAFRPGEIVYIVGGNGSGKSTLAKLITGLYPPESGEILLDGRSIGEGERDNYRQLFSAVFSDFYVFEALLGLERAEIDGNAQRYLAELHLDHKVKIRDGRFSTVELSQGQRKRLALLTAYLEDRPFYVFDEWASDQDPQFKEIFYRRMLPDLKDRGKAVVVITHDDRYFSAADRIIKLDYGKLIHEERADLNLFDPGLQTTDDEILDANNTGHLTNGISFGKRDGSEHQPAS